MSWRSTTTVILPVHGDCPFLSAAVRSVLSQADELSQLLVIDDGADERARSVLGCFVDPRFRVVMNRGSGLVDALNTGLQLAEGPFVARMDADDEMLPGRLQAQQSFLCAHDGVVAVGGQLELMDRNGVTYAQRRYPTDPRAVRLCMRRRNQLAHPAVMMRRSAAIAVGGYRHDYLGAEDYDLWLRMLEHGEIANLASYVLRYRIHPGQITHSRVKEVAEATYLAQCAANTRRLHGTELAPPWQVGTRPRTLPARVTRLRVRTAALAFERAKAAVRRRSPMSLAWAVMWACLRPVFAASSIATLPAWLRGIGRA